MNTQRMYAAADPGPPAHKLGDRLWYGGRKYGSRWVIITGLRLQPEVIEDDDEQLSVAAVWDYHTTTESNGREWGWVPGDSLTAEDPETAEQVAALDHFGEVRREEVVSVAAVHEPH